MLKPSHRRGVSDLLGLTLLSGAAAQQQPAQPVARVEVSGSAAAYDPRRDDTAAKFVVNSEELAKYGDTSVAEALKRVPGMTVVSTGRGADIRMRGLGAGYTQILVNGEPAPFGFSIDSVAPEQIERIEVFRSATAEFSTQSIAGTINIVMKRAARRPQRNLQLGYGGDRTERTPRAMLVITDRDAGFSYSLSAYLRSSALNRFSLITDTDTDTDTDELGRTVLAQHSRFDETGRFSTASVVPRLSWTLGNGDTLSLEAMLGGSRFRLDADQHTTGVIGPAPTWPQFTRGVRSHTANLQTDLVWTTRPAQGQSLEMKIGVQGAVDTNDSARIRAGHGVLAQNTIAFDASERAVNGSLKYGRKQGEAHQLSAGLEASRLARRETNLEINRGPADTRTDLRLHAHRTQAAAFVQDEWTVTPLWSIYLGVRTEHIDVRTDPVATPATVWSPIFQTLYKLPGHPDDQLRLALTRTFKAPGMADLLPRRRRNEINAATNPDLEGNPSLRPELATGIDLSYEHFFGKNALISAALSSRRISDYTVREVSLEGDGRWVMRPYNAGRARMHALELEVKTPLKRLSSALPAIEFPAIELRANVNRNWSSVERVPGPGNRMAQQVPLSATLGVDYVRGALTTGGAWVFRRGAWTRSTTMQSSETWNRRDVDLYALWKVDSQRQLRITFGNVLSEDTFAGEAYAANGTVSRRTTLAPGHLSIRALLDAKF